jgi:uncharacterized membrane protein
MINQLGRLLIFVGAIFLTIGTLLFFLGKITPLGRLPGDIHLARANFHLYFPLTTCILLSIVLSVILSLFFRR